MSNPEKIVKVLSSNDLGLTGGHQAGILVPKAPGILSFFPSLDASHKNPRIPLVFREGDGITRWEFAFIYYNNRFFGGTRNEYRLTHMTKYLRAQNARVADQIVLSRDEGGGLFIECQRAGKTEPERDDDVLVLSGGWKVISRKKGRRN